MNSIVTVFWNALLTAIVVTLLAGLFVAAMPPVYQATAIVKGDSDTMLKLQSADLLLRVVRGTKADLGELEGWLEQLMSARAEPVVLLKEKLTVSVGEDPEWVNVSVEAQSAKTASMLANEIAHLYLEQNARVRLSSEEKARLFVAVEESNARLLSYLKENPALILSSSGKARLDAQAEQSRKRQLALLDTLEQFEQQRLAAARGEIGVLTEPGVVRASQRLDALKLELAELTTRYGPLHQRMAGQKAEVRKAAELLGEALDAYQARIKLKILELERQLAEVDEAVIGWKVELDRFADQQLELKRLELEKEAAVRKFEGMTENSGVELVADAAPPRNTFGFNQLMLLGLVFLGSFMLMVILMVIRSLRAK